MKPIESTWEARGRNVTTTEGTIVLEGWAQPPEGIDAEASAKLAAEAPLMARMLASCEWGGARGCLACTGYPDAGHDPDCTWLALMRRIGERS